MYCSRFGKELDLSVSICPGCGREYAECEKCGKLLQDGEGLCEECLHKEKEKRQRKNLNDRLIKRIAALAAAVLVLLVFLLALQIDGRKKKGEGLFIYVKNGTYHIYNFKNMWTVEEEMTDITISRDEKVLFYLANGKVFKYLYLSKGKTPKVIDENVSSYHISEKGDTAYYMKENTLYRWSKGKIDKIAENVEGFSCSRDGERVKYTQDNQEYIYTDGKPLYFSNTVFYRNDFKEIWYVKDNRLYVYEKGKNELVVENVKRIFNIHDEGVYYLDQEDRLLWYDGRVHTVFEKVTDSYFMYRFERDKPIIVYEDNSHGLHVAVKDKVHKMKEPSSSDYAINSAGTKIIYRANSEGGFGDLVMYDVESGKSHLVDTKVIFFNFIPNTDKCIYFKTENNTITTFVDGVEVDKQIRIDSIKADAKGSIIYTKKSDSESVFLDLYIFKEDKPILVGETIADYVYFNDKAIVYKNGSKDLYFFDGKIKSKIDANVDDLLTVSHEYYPSDDFFDHDTLYSLFRLFL